MRAAAALCGFGSIGLMIGGAMYAGAVLLLVALALDLLAARP